MNERWNSDDARRIRKDEISDLAFVHPRSAGPGFGRVPGARKIAVLRANALGDFIFALPALDALRDAYPGAEIVLLGQRWHGSLLAGRPGPVDRVATIPAWIGVTAAEGAAVDPAAHERFCAAMRSERFDLAIQLHGGGRHSNPLVLQLAARVTAGLRTADAPPLDRWAPYVYCQSEVLRALEVVALVGAPVVTIEPHLAVTATDRAAAAAALPDDGRPLVVLHPGAHDPERRWPPARFAVVGDALAEAGARIALTGTAPEAPLTRAVRNAMHAPACDLAGLLSLGALTGLLSRCAVVVANDTGPLHLAAAVGAATVGVFWGFNLVTAGPVTTARHRPIAAWRRHCPICGADLTRTRCADRPSLVADVEAADVAAAALDLLASEATPWARVA